MSQKLPTLREKMIKSLDELDVRDFDSDLHKGLWADHLIDWLRTENSVRELLAYPGGSALWEMVAPWQPMDTLPEDASIVFAGTADGRIMLWKPSLLLHAMRGDTPEHLKFPAVGWLPVFAGPTHGIQKDKG